MILTGCQKVKFLVYTIPKAMSVPMISALTSEGQSQSRLTWTAPSTWKAQAPTAMRLASFAIPTKAGKDLDFSVVMLSGEAGGLLANVNRWRGQIQLPPLTQAQ